VRLATQLMDLGQVREAEKELSKLEIDQVSDREEYIHTRLRVLQARQGASVSKKLAAGAERSLALDARPQDISDRFEEALRGRRRPAV
jgi:hypothetical protein